MRGFSPLAPHFLPPMTLIVTTSESCHRENSKNQKLIVAKRIIILLVNTLCVRTFSTRYNCVTTLYTTWKIMCILWY